MEQSKIETFEYSPDHPEILTVNKLIYLEAKKLNIKVDEKEIEDYYSDHRKDYRLSTEKVEIKTVLFKLKKNASINEITELKREALRIAAEIQEGRKFEKIINQQKAVKGSAGIENVSGEFERGSLTPVLEKEAFSMKKGETSGRIWLRDGVYILKVVNKTEERFKPIGDVHKEIYSKIYEQKTENNFNDWVRTLWEKTSVKIH